MGLAEAGVRSSSDEMISPLAARGVVGGRAAARGHSASTQRAVGPDTALRARGYNACWVPENGFGSYTHWRHLPMGQMIMPLSGGHTDDGGYDVVIHFHGHEAVRHAFVEVAQRAVLVGIDLGNSSGPYEHAFEDPNAFTVCWPA